MPYDTFDVVPLARVGTCIRLQFRKWMRCRKSTVCTEAVNQNIILFEAQRRRQTESIQASACWVTRRSCSTAWWNWTGQTWRSMYVCIHLMLQLHSCWSLLWSNRWHLFSFRPLVACGVYSCSKWSNHTFFSFRSQKHLQTKAFHFLFSPCSSPSSLVKTLNRWFTVLLYMTPGSWDILDVLELWSWGYSTRPNVWVWCL